MHKECTALGNMRHEAHCLEPHRTYTEKTWICERGVVAISISLRFGSAFDLMPLCAQGIHKRAQSFV